jgi:hypothetical protein
MRISIRVCVLLIISLILYPGIIIANLPAQVFNISRPKGQTRFIVPDRFEDAPNPCPDHGLFSFRWNHHNQR